MKEFHISSNDAGQRFDRFLAKAVPLLPGPLMQKYFRLKRFKCHNKAVKGEYRLCQGDLIQLYINDEFFEKPTEHNAYLSIYKPNVKVIYEDDHIILVDKPAGMVVHQDENVQVHTLIAHVQAYLYQTKAWNPRESHGFAPALCNRIDRNTCGIVIAAKSAAGLREMNEKIKEHQMKKEYMAVIHGEMPKAQGKLEHYLLRDKTRKQVSVFDGPTGGAKTAITHYDVMAVRQGLSLLRCQLVTGRTHQIRAQLAHVGHPLLGDGKYGSLALDKPYGKKGQALCSYRLRFDFEGESEVLSPLHGKQFQVEQIDFVEQYFPDYTLK